MRTEHLCPFCHSGDLQLVEAVFEIGFYVCCNSCESQGPVGEVSQEAIDKWDNRPGGKVDTPVNYGLLL